MELSNSTIKVLVLADSRGRDLEKLLNEKGNVTKFTVEILPGASITVLVRRLHRIIADSKNLKYDLVVILGGICSITRMIHRPYRAAVPQLNSVDELMSKINGELELLHENQVTTPILLAPTVGIDLVRYAGQWSDDLYNMQPLVDKTVLKLNERMKMINVNNGLPTPNTSSCIHRCRGKGRGYRTHYQKLCDGCHLNEEVKEIWAKALTVVKLFST